MNKTWAFDGLTGETSPVYGPTFLERKAARKQASIGKVIGFQVRVDGEVVATFKDKLSAIGFTKASEVNTERFGWQVRPSGLARKIGSASSEPKCEITVLREIEQ